MATNFLSLRSSAAPSISAVNLTGSAITTSTITVSTLNLQSTTISLGQSTNQTYNNFSNGSYLTWASPKSDMTSANKTVQSANGLYQMLVANATSGLFLSSDSGITWSTLSGGLPTLTGSAYWSDGAISANGQYMTLSIYGGSLWMSADYGRTFALTNQPTPNIWLPLNGNTTDSMGLSVVTTPGTVPGYVTINYPGYTAQAVNLLNTAGAAPTRYIQGTWAGATNFTVSFWFNAQTNSSGTIFSSSSGQTQIYLFGNYLYYATMINGSFANAAGTSYVISSNTWYYVTATFLTNGLCSLYVNNTLIGSATNTTALSEVSSYYLGCNSSITGAFNGYIDDLRIYNSVSTYVPIPLLQPNIWMPFENTAGDLGSNAITPTVTGSLSYVPGIIGLNAVNIANTASGTAANYIRGAWNYLNNFTVSGWVNIQSLASSFQVIYSSHNAIIEIFLNPSGQLVAQLPTGSGASYNNIITTFNVSINTWYHLVMIFQINGLCSFLVNGSVIGTFTNSGGYGTVTSSGVFCLGTYDAGTSYALNGYVDDFRIYNAVIPYHTLLPQNYRSLALSGTGQYALAAAASGWVVGSSNSSQTWSKQAVNVGTQGSIIQPNKTGLVQSTWEQNGVNWTASASTTLSASYPAYNLFNNTLSSSSWAPSSVTYGSSGNSSGQTTVIQGTIGTVTGDWVQIQSSVPLIMASYQFASGGTTGQLPKTYYIVGSNDGTTWFPIQRGEGGTVTTTSTNTLVPGIIVVNSTSTQTFGSSAVATTAYPTSADAYSYFRIIGMTVYIASGAVLEISEWYVNFVRPSTQALSMNHTGQYQMVATGPAAGSVMPNQTGLAASTWSQGGINWTASANTAVYPSYRAFNNLNASAADKWETTAGSYTGGSFSYAGAASTSIQTIGSVGGDWLQIQSSVPLVLTSYSIGANDLIGRSPKTYYIVGSNDGSTWYPIQYCNFATIPFTATFTTTSYITVNLSGTQSITAGQTASATTTTYTFTTNAYTYFRMVTTHLFSEALINIGEWNMNFQNSVSYSSNYGSTWLNTSSTVSNESVALSASGQYTLSTNSVAPFVRLTFDNTNADAQGVLAAPTVIGTAPTYSTSNKVAGTHSINFANTAGGTSGLSYLNYTVPTALNTPSALTISCWVYLTSHPVVPSNAVTPLAFTNGATSGSSVVGAFIYFRPGEAGIGFNVNGGSTLYAASAISIPINTWIHACATYNGSSMILYINGVATSTINSAGRLTLSNGSSITNLFIGTHSYNIYAFAGNVDDVRIYTSALNAHEVAALYNNPTLTQTVAVSNSYLPITSYTKPVLPSITANIVDTAVSQTGQYMVAVTSSTTNNVYYSTDFGTTFTALTIGTTAMVSCSISYDGSYLTVESATTVHTLNRNTRGFSVAVGNQAGFVNQAQNAIAIGDKAGRTNQSANSIVLNASGSTLDAVAPGFYVAPIATAASSSAAPFNLLGYGTDNQVVQSSALTVLQNGNVGIGTNVPGSLLNLFGTMPRLQIIDVTSNRQPSIEFLRGQTSFDGNPSYSNWRIVASGGQTDGVMSALSGGMLGFYHNGGGLAGHRLVLSDGGNVGIGTTNPVGSLHIHGTVSTGLWNNSCLRITNGIATTDTTANGTSIQLHNGLNSYYFNIMTYGYASGSGSSFYITSDSLVGVTFARGQNAWSTYSDSRMKINKVPLSSELSNILKLNPVSYLYDSDPSDNVNIVTRVGFLADEVFDIYPNLVTKDSGMPHTNQDGETFIPMTMCMTNLIPYHTKAIQELAYKNDALEAKNTELTQKLDALSTRHAALLAWAETQGFSGTFS
jgi:hypothetical protein